MLRQSRGCLFGFLSYCTACSTNHIFLVPLGQEQQRGNREWLRSNTSLGTAGATSSMSFGSSLLWVPNPKGRYKAQGCSNSPRAPITPSGVSRATGTGVELQEELQE